jgi:2-keto-3-deoxy-L-rhamnonate aldolase RhmA
MGRIDEIASAAAAARGAPVLGAFVPDLQVMEALKQRGARFFAISSDLGVFRDGALRTFRTHQ